MLALLFTLAFANKCTYDSTRDNATYNILDNYHERYCSHACPCEGADCEMDFTYAPFREIEEASGNIGILTTRNYSYTFAVNVQPNAAYTIGKTQLKSARMHYKLKEGSTLSVGTQEVAEEYKEVATLTTIVRCNKSCVVKASEFPKTINDSISFMPEMNEEEEFINSTLALQDVTFHVQAASGHFEKNYARDQLTVSMENVKFIVEDDVSNVEVIGLFYAAIPLVDPKVEVVYQNNPNNVAFEIKQQCDNKWLVAVKQGSEAVMDCENEDPTISLGDAQLEEDCETAFIVIVCIADITLFLVIATFLVLILIPIFKKKNEKKYQEI